MSSHTIRSVGKYRGHVRIVVEADFPDIEVEAEDEWAAKEQMIDAAYMLFESEGPTWTDAEILAFEWVSPLAQDEVGRDADARPEPARDR